MTFKTYGKEGRNIYGNGYEYELYKLETKQHISALNFNPFTPTDRIQSIFSLHVFQRFAHWPSHG